MEECEREDEGKSGRVEEKKKEKWNERCVCDQITRRII